MYSKVKKATPQADEYGPVWEDLGGASPREHVRHAMISTEPVGVMIMIVWKCAAEANVPKALCLGGHYWGG